MRLVFLGVFLFIYLITQWQIKPEEYWLEKKFGESYLAYKKKSETLDLTNKKNRLKIGDFLYILRSYYFAAHPQSANFLVKRSATKSQFTTFQNSLM